MAHASGDSPSDRPGGRCRGDDGAETRLTEEDAGGWGRRATRDRPRSRPCWGTAATCTTGLGPAGKLGPHHGCLFQSPAAPAPPTSPALHPPAHSPRAASFPAPGSPRSAPLLTPLVHCSVGELTGAPAGPPHNLLWPWGRNSTFAQAPEAQRSVLLTGGNSIGKWGQGLGQGWQTQMPRRTHVTSGSDMGLMATLTAWGGQATLL